MQKRKGTINHKLQQKAIKKKSKAISVTGLGGLYLSYCCIPFGYFFVSPLLLVVSIIKETSLMLFHFITAMTFA
jgi:hypothetical protein